MTPKAMQKAIDKLRAWKHDPILFVRDNFKAEPDDWQADYLLSFRDNMRTAAKACKGVGKTTGMSWAGWWFMACFADANLICTSITGDNLRDGLWKEFAKWQDRSEFLKSQFTWQAQRIVNNDRPETWFASARKWAKDADATQQANTLAGLHADNIAFLIDEAGGIPSAVVATAEAALANAAAEVNPKAIARLLMAGNPTHLTGPLYDACTKNRSLYSIIEITADPDSPRRSKRVSLEWAQAQIKMYGRENPWVMVNVLGQFPPASLNSLVGPDDLNVAMNRQGIIQTQAPKILGVDVARQGNDSSVIFPRQGITAFKPAMYRNYEGSQLAGVVARAAQNWGADAINVDATGGFGYACIEPLRKMVDIPVNEVQFAASPYHTQYSNKRAEMYFELCNWVKNGGILPNCNELVEELTAMTYFFKGDKMALLDKEQIREVLGRSPDYADALACTFAVPVAKRVPSALMPILAQNRAKNQLSRNPLQFH